ncbi:regulatory protein [Chryseobacterium sp. SORGH_AS909]|uniref:Regulatory protein RecX n=2 Tax=Chryseobacterium group TaxID=2782232 RepID=A0ABU0TG53_9FLAO|nr:regulatory protein [Chryseobacterium camelliae]MDQ1099041.1 regulatory protein [Chryseobacterium sp. SORGH_AS_1048]MDR6086389.1 regulatory protein [Chryseobacterium sp. SORGH_AS_0909]MDR6130762.1 regulatory protein [Chryseobacterium sp. SORGH_AS_1175]MDT3407106.1 regulatory protein [Pseudacidovorax intermedius]
MGILSILFLSMEKKSFTYEEIKQKLVNYCVYQDRCHAEVEQKMREFLLIDEAKEEIMLYLLKENYLNEERFTRSYIRGKFYIKHWGRNKIRMNLKQKQVPEKLINKCFDEIDDEDYRVAIKKMYDNYYAKHIDLNEYQRKIKTIKHIIGKGFEYDAIINSIEE